MPTLDEIVTAIETGPLAAELAPLWATVFQEHPEKGRRPPRDAAEAQSWKVKAARAGRLHPDAAHAIAERLRATYPDITRKQVQYAKDYARGGRR